MVKELVILCKKSKKKQVLQEINYLVAEAEKELGSKTGKYKKSKVIGALYDKFPLVLTIFFTRKEIEDFIDYYAAKLKIFLENEENNLEGYRNLTPVKTFYPSVDKTE